MIGEKSMKTKQIIRVVNFAIIWQEYALQVDRTDIYHFKTQRNSRFSSHFR